VAVLVPAGTAAFGLGNRNALTELQTLLSDRSPSARSTRGLFIGFAANALAGGIILAVSLHALSQILALEPGHFARTMTLYALIALLVTAAFKLHAPHHQFGAANRVTLFRALLTCLLAGFVGYGPLLPQYLWLMTAVAAFVLLLDGLDGWVARKLNTVSPLGGLFDQELDALFILILGILVFDTGKVGIWVVASGLFRYILLAAGLIWSKLRRAPPPSFRARAVCVLQILVLIAALAPVTSAAVATAAAAFGLAALFASFAQDVAWLLRQDSAVSGPAG